MKRCSRDDGSRRCSRKRLKKKKTSNYQSCITVCLNNPNLTDLFSHQKKKYINMTMDKQTPDNEAKSIILMLNTLPATKMHIT